MLADPRLIEALEEAQRLGFLGERDLSEVITHAQGFAMLVDDVDPESSGAPVHVVDLGSGAGVPGLIVADAHPGFVVTLVDRRAKRTDFLERIVRRLGWEGRVVVRCVDAGDLARSEPHCFDAAVARGFGPPLHTLDAGLHLVRPGGRIVISEPPHGDRWDAAELARRRLTHRDVTTVNGRYAVFTVG